jgi:hypothetical protein
MSFRFLYANKKIAHFPKKINYTTLKEKKMRKTKSNGSSKKTKTGTRRNARTRSMNKRGGQSARNSSYDDDSYKSHSRRGGIGMERDGEGRFMSHDGRSSRNSGYDDDSYESRSGRSASRYEGGDSMRGRNARSRDLGYIDNYQGRSNRDPSRYGMESDDEEFMSNRGERSSRDFGYNDDIYRERSGRGGSRFEMDDEGMMDNRRSRSSRNSGYEGGNYESRSGRRGSRMERDWEAEGRSMNNLSGRSDRDPGYYGDDYGSSSSRGRTEGSRGGWFGDSEGHSEARRARDGR